MRPVLYLDVAAAARALLALPAGERDSVCGFMLRDADWADRYTRRLQRMHPVWGNGTLLAAARQWPLAAEPTFDDPAYRSCFALVLRHLDRRSTCLL